MSPWLPAQVLYAAAAWSFASRVVINLHRFAGYAGRGLAGTVRELRRTRRGAELSRLAALLEPSPLGPLFEPDASGLRPDELVARAQDVAAMVRPPVRVLRALATMGTMLGLLAAVASLRAGLDATTATTMERAAAAAFDSAVVGFVTALPCWSAIALSSQRMREALSELDAVVLALATEPGGSEPLPAETGEPLDSTPPTQ